MQAVLPSSLYTTFRSLCSIQGDENAFTTMGNPIRRFIQTFRRALVPVQCDKEARSIIKGLTMALRVICDFIRQSACKFLMGVLYLCTAVYRRSGFPTAASEVVNGARAIFVCRIRV